MMRILEDFVFEHLAPHGIRHIAPVSLAMASGQVAEVYREMGRDFMLAPPLTVHSPIPELLAGVWAAARESLICRPAGRVAREAIAASVSRINDCPYCVDVHSMMLDGAGEHGLAAAAANHGVYGDVDAGIARIMAWAAATRTPDSPLLATPPFWAEDIPQMFGTAVMFHYINRITNVFLDKSPLPFPSGRSTKRIAGSLLASRIVKVSASPDQARRLPDTAQLPADFGWTASNRVVAGAFAQMAAAVESAGQAAVPLSVRKQLHERLREWRGADPGLSRAWVEAAVEDIDPSERAAARLVLLTAFASYQVDDGVIEAFRATGDGDARLVATVAWASFCAARKVAPCPFQPAMPIHREENIVVKPKILITGATGKTGAATVKQLLERGYPVRALVRRADERSSALKRLGAEIQIGSLHDIDDVRLALEGVQRAYFCAPLLRDGLSASAVFAAAADECHLEIVVALSQWLADPRHPSIHTRETWLADKMLSWMPNVDLVTVNPGWFADNYMAALEPIAQFGMMPMPLGEGLNAPPSNEDIARVIVGALTKPAAHVGKTYRPTGPALLSPPDIAATFAKVLGRPVKYIDAPVGMFTKVARVLGFPDFTTAQVLWYFEDYKRNAFAMGAPTQAVQEVTGQEPEGFEAIVRRYVRQSPLVERRPASLARAMVTMMKIVFTPALNADHYARTHDFPVLARNSLAVASSRWLTTHAPDTGALPRC